MKSSLFITGILLLLSISVSAQAPALGMVAYWPLTGNANDSSSYANNGTLVNGAFFTSDRHGSPNHAIQFDKSLSQYVSIPNSTSLQIDNELSISVWVKRNSLGGVDQVLNKGGDWPSGTCNYGLAFSEWTMVFIYNGGYYYVAEPGVPQDYEWHHYLVTTANGTPDVTFYIDGIKKQSALGDGSNPTVNLYSQSAADLYIGGTIYFSNNSQDDIRIYNRLLTEGEIQDVFYDGTVSVPENSFTNGIVISPNPTQGNFKVNLGASFGNVKIQIADINGKTVKTDEYKEGQVFSLNLSEPDGIYYLRIESENRNATFLLIKN